MSRAGSAAASARCAIRSAHLSTQLVGADCGKGRAFLSFIASLSLKNENGTGRASCENFVSPFQRAKKVPPTPRSVPSGMAVLEISLRLCD